MNFFSIFVVLVVVALHNRRVDARLLRGEDPDLEDLDEIERVELMKQRLKTEETNGFPYSEWIRKPKKMAKHYGINPIPPDFKERCGVSGFEKWTYFGDQYKLQSGSRFFCATMLFTSVPAEGYPPLCYMCHPYDRKCWFHLGAMASEDCIGAGIFVGFGPTDPDLDGWLNNLGTSAENPGMPPPLNPEWGDYVGPWRSQIFHA